MKEKNNRIFKFFFNFFFFKKKSKWQKQTWEKNGGKPVNISNNNVPKDHQSTPMP